MKKHIIVIGIVVLLLVVGFSGCNENNNTLPSDEEKIVGTWKKSNVEYEWEVTMTMLPNGTIITGGYEVTGSGKWELKDGKFILTWMEEGETKTDSWHYSFSDDYNTLYCTNLENDFTSVYERQ